MLVCPDDVRAWIALGFGLIHGFGFANVLAEMELPRRTLGWALFSFNVGVEIGQLAIVAIVASAFAALRARNEMLGKRLVVVGSIVLQLPLGLGIALAVGCATAPKEQRTTQGPTAEQLWLLRVAQQNGREPTFEERVHWLDQLDARISRYLIEHPEVANSFDVSTGACVN